MKNLPKTAITNYYSKTIFLEVLLQSDVSLYLYKDDKAIEHFYIKMGKDDLIELIDFKYILNNRYVKEIKKYIGQLTFLLKDCETIKNEIGSTSYSAKSILKLIENYNECKNNEIVYHINQEKFRFDYSFSINAGIAMTTVDFSASVGTIQTLNLAESDFGYSLSPTFGINGDFMFPYLRKRFGINVNLHLLNYDANGNSEIIDSQTIYDKNNQINLTYLGTVVGLKYVAQMNKLKPFLMLGITNSFIINEKTKTSTHLTHYSVERDLDDQEILDHIRTHAQGFDIEAGFEYSWFVFGIRYLSDNGVSELTNLGSSNKSYSILLGYKF